MKIEITKKDLENPRRFVGEGLGAPEALIKRRREAKAQSADRIHCLRSK